MKYVIKHKKKNGYLCSVNNLVSIPQFARKFNSEKQAKAYILTSVFEKKMLLTEPLDNLHTELYDGIV